MNSGSQEFNNELFALWRGLAALVGQIRLTGQRFPDSPQKTFFVERLEQARDRFGFADYFSGLRIVAPTDEDRRQAPS